jgi:hypothetical protein
MKIILYSIVIFVFVGCLTLTFDSLDAQVISSTNYKIQRFVTEAAGVSMSSTNYKVKGTLGQSISPFVSGVSANYISSLNYRVYGGFWSIEFVTKFEKWQEAF